MDRFLEQVAIEASQMYFTEGGGSRFSRTVRFVIFQDIFLFS